MAALPPVSAVRAALATSMATALGVSCLPGTPAQATANTAFVRPTPGADYLDFTEGTYDAPVVSLSVVVLAGASDWVAALDWLDAKAAAAWLAMDTDPTLGGLISPAPIVSVSEPGRLGNLLAVRLDLAPAHLVPKETP